MINNNYRFVFTFKPYSIKWFFQNIRFTGALGILSIALVVQTYIPKWVKVVGFSGDIVNVIRAIFLILIFSTLILTNKDNIKLKEDSLNKYIFLYCFLYLSSTLWSQIPLETLGKGLEITACLLLFVCCLDRDRGNLKIRGILNLLLHMYYWFLIFALLGFFYADKGFSRSRPSLLFENSYSSPYLSANAFGYMTVSIILFIVIIWLDGRMSTPNFFIISMPLILSFLTMSSRTSIGIFCLGFFLISFRYSKKIFLFLITSILILASVFFNKFFEVFFLQKSFTNFITLNGRVIVWIDGLTQWITDPLSVFIGSGGGIGPVSVLQHYGLTHVHNGFIEILVSNGLLGFVIFMFPFVVATYFYLNNWHRLGGYKEIGILVLVVLVTTIMAIGVAWLRPFLFFYFAMVTLLDWHRIHRPNRSEVKHLE